MTYNVTVLIWLYNLESNLWETLLQYNVVLSKAVTSYLDRLLHNTEIQVPFKGDCSLGLRPLSELTLKLWWLHFIRSTYDLKSDNLWSWDGKSWEVGSLLPREFGYLEGCFGHWREFIGYTFYVYSMKIWEEFWKIWLPSQQINIFFQHCSEVFWMNICTG